MSLRGLSLFVLGILGCSGPSSVEGSGLAASATSTGGGGGAGGTSLSQGGNGGSGGAEMSVCGDGVVGPDEACDDSKKGVCPGDCQCTFTLNEHCYVFVPTISAWATAYALCQGLGMHMTSLTTMAEFNFVTGTVDPFIDTGGGWWTGANDRASKGMYVWDDDTPLGPETKGMWGQGEPVVGGPPFSCILLYDSDGQFHVANCKSMNGFVCESL